MTNTYSEHTPLKVKTYEEMRCIRCVLERILRVMDEGLFVDYQMEKYGKAYKTRKAKGDRKTEIPSSKAWQKRASLGISTPANSFLNCVNCGHLLTEDGKTHFFGSMGSAGICYRRDDKGEACLCKKPKKPKNIWDKIIKY